MAFFERPQPYPQGQVAFAQRRTGTVIKPSNHQSGKPKTKEVRRKPALQAGKRISRNGKVYYEYRRNRSSLSGRLQ